MKRLQWDRKKVMYSLLGSTVLIVVAGMAVFLLNDSPREKKAATLPPAQVNTVASAQAVPAAFVVSSQPQPFVETNAAGTASGVVTEPGKIPTVMTNPVPSMPNGGFTGATSFSSVPMPVPMSVPSSVSPGAGGSISMPVPTAVPGGGNSGKASMANVTVNGVFLGKNETDNRAILSNGKMVAVGDSISGRGTIVSISKYEISLDSGDSIPYVGEKY